MADKLKLAEPYPNISNEAKALFHTICMKALLLALHEKQYLDDLTLCCALKALEQEV